MKPWQLVNRKPRIEMVPLIDCFFLILVFFIYGVLSMVVQKGLSVQLPKASASVLSQEDYLSITVTKTGEIFLNKQPASLEQLPLILSKEKTSNPKQKVFINADKFAYHGRVIRVLDMVRSAGIEQVSFETDVGDPENE
jgi:biopolymer transport protein ExbD